MKLFGKKKEEEYEDGEELVEEDELADKKLTRKFKDLKPENKKKRKEPPKPWGKTERLIVGGIFLVTTISATTMFLFSHGFKFPGLPKITFKSIKFDNLFKEEVIQIGQKKTYVANDENAEKLVSYFEEKTKPLSGHYGFLVIRLKDGSTFGVSNDSKFQGASLLKLPLMALVYKMSDEGMLDLDTKYILKDSDKIKGSGGIADMKSGTIYTYKDLVRYMGKNSDRTAYKIMKGVVTDSELSKFLEGVEMVNTDIVTGETTPDDIGTLYKQIWNGSLLTDNAKEELLGFLTDTIYEKWISGGIPNNVKVAHKVGIDAGVAADAGIIEANSPYILVLMGEGITGHDADILYPKFSSEVFNFLGR